MREAIQIKNRIRTCAGVFQQKYLTLMWYLSTWSSDPWSSHSTAEARYGKGPE
jgi:hypothetical protein